MQQNFKMLPERNGLSLQSPLRPLSVLVFHLLLTHSCRGQSQLIGQSQPIVATIGDDIILPCHLEPAVDVAAMILEWTRSDLSSVFVFVWRAGQDLVHTKHPSYKGRTSLFTDELKRGNISLKLSDVRPSDAGRYRCFIPDLNIDSFVELVVGAASSPVISLAGIDRDKGGVVLQCESAGWYPEPEVLWLDGEGKLLSAGPTETVRGPDDLYTVSSRVTVEKRHSNSFTCRVQQSNINQTTETHIHVPDDFFKVQSNSSTITGLAVSLAVCILILFAVVLYVWKQRANNENELTNAESKEAETKRLLDTKTSEWTDLQRQLQEEKKTNTNLEKEVMTLKQDIQIKDTQLQEEKKTNTNLEEEVMTLKQDIQMKDTQVQDEHTRKEEAERQVQRKQQELQKKTQQFEGNQAETIKQLQVQTQLKDRAQREVQTLKKQLETKIREEAETKRQLDTRTSEWRKLQTEEAETKRQLDTKTSECRKLQTELQVQTQLKDRAQREVQTLKNQLETKIRELQDEKKKKTELENDVKTLKEELQNKDRQLQDEKKEEHRAGERTRDLEGGTTEQGHTDHPHTPAPPHPRTPAWPGF